MTHDPLCKVANTEVPVGHVGVIIECDCYRVRYVRNDMLAKCIAAVEDLHPKHCFPSDHPYQMKRAALAALRALQEKP